MKKLVLLVTLCFPVLLFAQSENTEKGIRWTTGLSWEQVKEKAKAENKYIFVDAYATWCGPCKAMDKSVYVNDTVGEYFNDKFTSVKVQMDRIKNDNEEVQAWYKDADEIKNQYKVTLYPTFIFLSPQGQIVHKETGFKGVKDFLAIGQAATMPGKVFNDPFEGYDLLVDDFKRGIINYERLPFMIKSASKLGDTALNRHLFKVLSSYVLTLMPEERYTKERIELWNSMVFSTSSKVFSFFYKDGALIDKVMNKKGYAASFIDKLIQYEIVSQFFKIQERDTIMGVKLPIRRDGKITPDYSEADWKKLYQIILKKFNSSVANRNVIAARAHWYKQHGNYNEFAKYYLKRNNLYQKINPEYINDNIFQIFKYVSDKKLLSKGAILMESIINQYHDPNRYTWDSWLDTYANLLYKIGRTQEAIKWQIKALEAPNTESKGRIKLYQRIIEQMRNGEPTLLEEGANWEDIRWVNWQTVVFTKPFLVTDTNQKVLSGVTIFNTKNKKHFLTNVTGYVIPEVSVGDILIVSSPGFRSQEIVIKKDAFTTTIVLEPDITK